MPKKSKRVPCNRYLNVALAHTGSAQDSHYLDIAKLLSQTNRRLYRQGKVYRVKSITVVNQQQDFQLRVAGVPNTWISRNAWKRGKAAWDKMNKMALENHSMSVIPRWHDFKVLLSTGMTSDADQVNCIDINGNASDAGEWIYSEFQSPDGGTSSDSFMAYMLGGHDGSAGSRNFIGLIQSYGESRVTVSSTPAGVDTDGDDDPLVNLFDSGTHIDEIVEDLQSNNDLPPYAGSPGSGLGDDYPGASGNMPSAVLFGVTSATDIAGGAPVGRIGSFDAVCGLIEFETSSASDQSIELLIELAPGDYKGVHAEEI